MKKIFSIALQLLPIVGMILLIPLVKNDFVLAGVYVGIIIISLGTKHDRNDIVFLLFGAIGLFFSEWLFISTGVEIFVRNSLLGLMPVWLPVLWGYAFVVMKRSITILDKK